MSKKIGDYRIGESLWRYVSIGGVFEYVVVGVRQYEGETQLEVECQSCRHGWKCRSLIAQDDYGRIIELHMLNNVEEDDQRAWHGNYDGNHFWPTKQEARDEHLRRLVAKAKDEVREAKARVERAEKRHAELAALLDTPETTP